MELIGHIFLMNVRDITVPWDHHAFSS